MTATLIMTKQASNLDPSISKRAFAFLKKITDDDTAPGLHIEPITQARDPRVRTGRVDQQYRAVLFKLTGGQSTTYVLHGIWNHDDAIAVARRIVLTVNPVNGLPEIRDVDQERADAGLPPLDEATEAASPSTWAASRATPPVPQSTPPSSTPTTAPDRTQAPVAKPAAEPFRIAASREDLVDRLGLPAGVADAALAAHTERDLQAVAEKGPEWQQLALVGLGAGLSVAEVQAELDLSTPPASTPSAPTTPTAATPTATGSARAASDEELLASLERPAASISFARIEGVEELRRVIDSGNFGAWRVFLHPQQRRFATLHTNGPFRLSGGAGTGKTVVLLHRAKHLLDANPTARVVLTTYTVNLASGLRRDLDLLDPDLPSASALGEPGAYVAGIDAIAWKVLNSAGDDLRTAVEAVLGLGHVDVLRRTPHTAWSQAVESAGSTLPDRLRSPQFFRAEYDLVVLPQRIIERDAYLRVRRPGRGVRLSRSERAGVWEVIQAYRLAARMDGTVDFQEAASIAAEYLARRARERGEWSADHVLIDEGQDMTPAHWQLVRALVEPGPDDLFIAEDSHQRIYGNKITLSHYGIATRGRSRRLTLNYRTTAQNLLFADTILDGGSYSDLEDEPESIRGYQSAREGPAPVLKGCQSVSEELDFAASTLSRWVEEMDGHHLETIGILVRDSRQRDLVTTGLGERGVAVRAIDRSATPGAPVVMTMHRAKGTEFARVLLFGVSSGSIPISLREYDFSPEDRSDALLRERSLLYVAASRARDELVVTWSGKPSQLMPEGLAQ